MNTRLNQRRLTAARVARRVRPGLESLEDRVVLSVANPLDALVNSSAEMAATAVDASGDIYAAGCYAIAGSGYDPNSPAGFPAPADGGTNGSIVKYSPAGVVLWSQTFSAPDASNQDNGLDGVAVDAHGDVYVSGYNSDGPIVAKLDPATGDVDWQTQFTDANGEYRPYGSNAANAANALTVDSAGDVDVAGTFSWSLSIGTDTVSALGLLQDIFVARLDSSGNLLALIDLGATGTIESAVAITSDSSRNLYIAGSASTSMNAGEIYVAQITSFDTVGWTIETGDSTDNSANGVVIDGAGNLDVDGTLAGTAALTGSVTSETSVGESQLFLWRLNRFTGAASYAGGFGDANTQTYGAGLATDASGNLFMVGQYAPSTTSSYVFVAEVGSANQVLENQIYGGSREAVGETIAVNASDKLAVAGSYYNEELDLDSGGFIAGLGSFFLAATGLAVKPTAVDETYSTPAGAALTVDAAGGLLTSDSAPFSLSLEIETYAPTYNVSGMRSSEGTLTLNPDGSFTYTPPTGFAGQTSFYYTVTDGTAESAPALVTFDVGVAITGTVSLDQTGAGGGNAALHGLGGRTVYLDVNNDDRLDSGDPRAATNGQGQFTLWTALTGPLTLRAVLNPGEIDTTTNGGGSLMITASGDQGVTNVNRWIETGSTLLPLTPLNPTTYGPNQFTDLPTAEATALYETILDRAPDAGGLAANVALIKGGTPISQVASALMGSAEYYTDVARSDYENYLGRAGAPAEIALWVAQFEHGLTKAQAAVDFLTSTEFENDHEQDETGGYYSVLLDRQASGTDENNVNGELLSGVSRATIIQSIVNSAESYDRTIEQDYTVFLGRAADPGGLAGNLYVLQNGLNSLAGLALSFTNSAEFVKRAQAAVKS